MSSSISYRDSDESRGSYRDSVERPTRRRDWALIAGWVTGPTLFLTALNLNYALANRACLQWPLHVVVLVGIAAAVASGMWAWRAGGGDPPSTRRRFMAAGGLAIALGSALVLASLELPVFALGPCVS